MEGWRLTAFEVIERLSHVYHMSEIWVAAGKKYKKVMILTYFFVAPVPRF